MEFPSQQRDYIFLEHFCTNDLRKWEEDFPGVKSVCSWMSDDDQWKILLRAKCIWRGSSNGSKLIIKNKNPDGDYDRGGGDVEDYDLCNYGDGNDDDDDNGNRGDVRGHSYNGDYETATVMIVTW